MRTKARLRFARRHARRYYRAEIRPTILEIRRNKELADCLTYGLCGGVASLVVIVATAIAIVVVK